MTVFNGSVRYVELDLGQPRFNLPGLVATYELGSAIHANCNNFISLFGERKWAEFIGENHNFNCQKKYISAAVKAVIFGTNSCINNKRTGKPKRFLCIRNGSSGERDQHVRIRFWTGEGN